MPLSFYGRLARKYGPKLERPSRRDVLRAAAAASAGLLLSGCEKQRSRRGAERPTPRGPGGTGGGPRVIIVGAGLAGLACAHELLAGGGDPLILEARPRVAGRVHTLHDFVPGKTVEA